MTKIRLGVRRVAFLGSSTASRSFAPFGNPDWEIWATGPGIHTHENFINDFDRWFELHGMAENDPKLGNVLDQGYWEFLEATAKKKKVYYKPPIYEGLTGEKFPWDEIAANHCGFFLDSTIAWMMAMCLDCCDVDEIGLFGIDFATNSERIMQRKGTKHFMELFRMKGVAITIPEISEMSFDPQPYPCESSLSKRIHSSLRQLEPQVMEAETKKRKAQQTIEEEDLRLENLRGTMESLLFVKDNWT